MIRNEPVLFSKEQVKKIELVRNAKYVCTTEHENICVEVFYGSKPHHVSGSRYFGLYRTSFTDELMITSGAFIEDQKIAAIVSDNGEIIYSRYRHDYVKSSDGTVFIDGGRAYTKCSMVPPERRVTLIVRDGVLKVQND
jgi:hypothetical protein